MDIKDYQKLLEKYLDGTCTEAEKELLDRWYDSLQSGLPVDDTESEQLALVRSKWLELAERQSVAVEQTALRPVFSRKRLLRWAAAAAIFAGLIGTQLLTRPAVQSSDPPALAAEIWSEISSTDKAQMVILSDGSKVTLMTDSRMSYHTGFGEVKREVHLFGEAYFEVASDPERPFYVYANGTVTKVLGTSFLVNARDHSQNVEVLVTKGKVSVFPANQGAVPSEDAVVLTPKQQVSYNTREQRMVLSVIEQPEAIVPQEVPRQVTFDNAPLPALLDAMQGAYQVQIRFDRQRYHECTITTSMEEETLDEMLSIITSLLEIQYTRSGDALVLTGKGC